MNKNFILITLITISIFLSAFVMKQAITKTSITMNTQIKTKGEDGKFVFPALPYAYEALEPYVDKMTMEIHYSKHHRAYFDNFMKAIAETELENMSIEDIFKQISKFSPTIRNNGGGFYNHILFWESMSPNAGGQPQGKLMDAIVKKFGSFDDFKTKFSDAGKTRFGSGWAWLSVDENGQLFISSTANQDNPLMDVVEQKGTPILALDVWEHAYYLKYQNKRPDYIAAFWNVVDWKKVESRYSKLVTK